MTPDTAWIYAILPFLTMAVLTFGFVVVFRQRAKARRAVLAAGPPPPRRAAPRPWWARPALWLAIAVAAVLLGSFVWAGLYALVVLIVPLAWRSRPRRAPSVDPRSNGHAHRDGGAFTAE